ncbi:hypothetical protein [Streptomyces sp. x-80]|jgi:DnaJ-class molecular chaperone|uniref:hypothetical protein n=1 Tax=Streptomyces sp. x-80 TaxID=2789282 RepID=UPI003980423C
MPQHVPTDARVCPSCDGFSTAAITTGTRHQDGSRVLVPVTCRSCHGAGYAPAWLAAPSPIHAGR